MSSFGPSIYHTARYTIQGCDCMSMQQLSRKKIWMLLPTFFHFLGHHFWVPFLGPIFWCPVPFLRENLTGAGSCRFKNGAPVFGAQKLHHFCFFSQKRASSHRQKTCVCWLSKQPFCTNMHKNLAGIELRWHEGKIIRILDLTSGTAPSQKLVRN